MAFVRTSQTRRDHSSIYINHDLAMCGMSPATRAPPRWPTERRGPLVARRLFSDMTRARPHKGLTPATARDMEAGSHVTGRTSGQKHASLLGRPEPRVLRRTGTRFRARSGAVCRSPSLPVRRRNPHDHKMLARCHLPTITRGWRDADEMPSPQITTGRMLFTITRCRAHPGLRSPGRHARRAPRESGRGHSQARSEARSCPGLRPQTRRRS